MFIPGSRIRVFHAGSRIWDSRRHRILDPGVKKTPDPGSGGQKDTGSRIRGSKRHLIPDPGGQKDTGFAALKLTNNLSICNPKFYQALGNMIRDVFFIPDLGSGYGYFPPSRIRMRIQGPKNALRDLGSGSANFDPPAPPLC
jgi:hypothetical protein